MLGFSLAILTGSVAALYENRKNKNLLVEVTPEPMPIKEEEIRENIIVNIPYGTGRFSDSDLPTATLIEDDSLTLKVTNHNCVPIDVKLFYTGTGENSLNNFNNDWVRNKVNFTTDDWGGEFLDADGKVWVADGKNLPFAFNRVVQLNVLYSLGSGQMISLSTQVGEAIDAFLLRFSEHILALNPSIGYDLGQMSPLGSQIYYDGKTCYFNFIQYNQKLGASSPQQVEVVGFSTATAVSKDGNVFTFNLSFPLPTDWNVPVEIRDLSTLDSDGYIEFVNSLLDQSLYLENIRKYSNNSEQVAEPISFKSYDSDGNEQRLTQTQVLNPYQPQPVLEDYADIVIDGQTFAELTMLAGEYIELKLIYDKIGVLTYEEIERLDKAQGKEITREENKELQEAYVNFSGFQNSKKTETILLLFILGLLLYKK